MGSKITERLLVSAQELFWKYGIKKTTVEEIAKNAGTSKMSFYRNFENKEDIAKQVLTRFMGDALSQYTQIMTEEAPFNTKMLRVMNLEYQESKKMSNEFLQDILTNDIPELKDHFTRLSDNYSSAFVRDLFIAQERGDIRKDIKISFLLNMLSIMTEQMSKESFTSMYETPEGAVKELGQFFLYGIFPPRESS